jgi:predicted RNA-binding Zn ribbon-like protein
MVTSSSGGAHDRGAADRSEPDYRFDFCGGHVAIDFTNTVGDRGGEPQEHFNTFGDIVAWAEARGVVSRRRAAALRHRAASDPEGARRAYRRAIELREALYRVLGATADVRRPSPADLGVLNAHVSATFAGAALSSTGVRFTLETAGDDGLDDVVRPVVRAAVDLLTSAALVAHIGRCADDSCAWLFLDTTRSRTRRWCDMKSCGNRNKVRRFRRVSRAARR